jgi:hypothetical protein
MIDGCGSGCPVWPVTRVGHKSVDTTTRFYAGMEGAAALEHYDNSILKLRGKVTAQATSAIGVPPTGRK